MFEGKVDTTMFEGKATTTCGPEILFRQQEHLNLQA